MYGVELYARVRLAVFRDGLSQREAARRFGIDRGTVSKMLKHPEPPGYRRMMPVRRPKLADHVAFIDEILDADERAPRKQRHTARRIFERLRDERGYDGCYSTVRDYLRPRRQARKEVFVPLAHPPGHAQADFGEAVVVLGGVERKVRFFVMDLPQSDAIFVKAYHAETAEAFCDGHVSAFAFFGGVPLSILYDNTTLAVAQILGDGTRRRSALFGSLQSHYLFEDRFGRPAKGNDKGKVEGMVGFARQTFPLPNPHAHDIDALNALLLERCIERQQAVLRGAGSTIADRLAVDRAAFLALPGVAFDACDKRPGRVSSQALVRYRNNDYSVPVAYAHREVIVRGYVDAVVIAVAGEEIARHRRSYETADFVFNPLHYLALLEEKGEPLERHWSERQWRTPSTRQRRCRAGNCRRRSRPCAGCSRPASAAGTAVLRASASSYRFSGCSRPSRPRWSMRR